MGYLYIHLIVLILHYRYTTILNWHPEIQSAAAYSTPDAVPLAGCASVHIRMGPEVGADFVGTVLHCRRPVYRRLTVSTMALD